MRFADRLYSLALRAYPRDFRDNNREEVLGTIADLRDAGEARGVVRQTISLGYNGNRLRWLRATGGSVAQTFRQGLAWGVLILIARHAGLGLQDLFQQWYYLGGHVSLSGIALTAGWLAVFALLVGGRRKWGLVLLGVVMAGFVAERVAFSLSYGGPFDWQFTFRFFLPTIVPLLFAYLRPASRLLRSDASPPECDGYARETDAGSANGSAMCATENTLSRRPVRSGGRGFALQQPPRPVRVSWRLAAVLLVLAAAIPVVSLLFGPDLPSHFFQLGPRDASYVAWAIQFAFWLCLGVFVFLASLSDPRWAVATTLLVFVRLIDEFISEVGRVIGFGGYSGVLIIAVLVPAGPLLLSFWARRRAVPRRGRV